MIPDFLRRKAKPEPMTDAERRASSRRYRRIRGQRTPGLRSSVHARKMPASLYREDPGLNHAGRKRKAFQDWWLARRRDAGLA